MWMGFSQSPAEHGIAVGASNSDSVRNKGSRATVAACRYYGPTVANEGRQCWAIDRRVSTQSCRPPLSVTKPHRRWHAEARHVQVTHLDLASASAVVDVPGHGLPTLQISRLCGSGRPSFGFWRLNSLRRSLHFRIQNRSKSNFPKSIGSGRDGSIEESVTGPGPAHRCGVDPTTGHA